MPRLRQGVYGRGGRVLRGVWKAAGARAAAGVAAAAAASACGLPADGAADGAAAAGNVRARAASQRTAAKRIPAGASVTAAGARCPDTGSAKAAAVDTQQHSSCTYINIVNRQLFPLGRRSRRKVGERFFFASSRLPGRFKKEEEACKRRKSSVSTVQPSKRSRLRWFRPCSHNATRLLAPVLSWAPAFII